MFRTKRGVPISRRRYDTLFGHVQAALPWTVRTPVTAHALRHTGATTIERRFGLAIAETWLGNEPPTVAATYTKARLEEVATAVEEISGEPHPLAVVTGGKARHVA